MTSEQVKSRSDTVKSNADNKTVFSGDDAATDQKSKKNDALTLTATNGPPESDNLLTSPSKPKGCLISSFY